MKRNTHQSNIKTWFWFSSSSMKTAADAIISPFIPLYGLELNASSTQIGLLVSITSLVTFFQIIWAKIAEKRKRLRHVAIISNYFSSFFNFIYAFLRNIIAFISLRGFQSVIASASVPTSATIFAKRTKPQDWGYWNSINQAFLVLGNLVGVLLGGFLAGTPLPIGAAVASLSSSCSILTILLE